MVVAFSERTGGVSAPPFDSLNLAAHVGDDPGAVDENRRRVLTALDLEGQVGDADRPQNRSTVITSSRWTLRMLGVARWPHPGLPPVPATDALLTLEAGLPLLMCYADCVPIVLVAPGATPGVAVVHAGWRGALAGLPGATAAALAEATGSAPGELLAYVGSAHRSMLLQRG